MLRHPRTPSRFAGSSPARHGWSTGSSVNRTTATDWNGLRTSTAAPSSFERLRPSTSVRRSAAAALRREEARPCSRRGDDILRTVYDSARSCSTAARPGPGGDRSLDGRPVLAAQYREPGFAVQPFTERRGSPGRGATRCCVGADLVPRPSVLVVWPVEDEPPSRSPPTGLACATRSPTLFSALVRNRRARRHRDHLADRLPRRPVSLDRLAPSADQGSPSGAACRT